MLCVHLNTLQVVALAAGFLWQWWASYKGFNVSATHSISESRLSALLSAAAVLAALFCRVMVCPEWRRHDTCYGVAQAWHVWLPQKADVACCCCCCRLCSVQSVALSALPLSSRCVAVEWHVVHLPSQGVAVGNLRGSCLTAVCTSADRATRTQFSLALDNIGRASTPLLPVCPFMSLSTCWPHKLCVRP